MRIITGKLKGRRFDAPKDVQIRPTSDRAKEGLFNVIEARRYINGARVLDLFSGSGNLAFEAISRGALQAVLVEASHLGVKQIEKTAAQFGIADQVTAYCVPVERYLAQRPVSYDLVFADPPYDLPGIPEMVETVVHGGWLAPDGWFILEHDVRHLFHEHPNCVFTKPYGRTVVSIFMLKTGDDESEADSSDS
ncbi:MAG: 16S rRNA (guanine(966)-N(2))-methyltransferase RsmD [Balneolales bacterium]|nr:16S rRNA (guanine(966)-N(2))-methyltransferase RsmD [Balneolales bacterium]